MIGCLALSLLAGPGTEGLPLPRDLASEGFALEGVERVWDGAPHCAFTDLLADEEGFLLAFREGRGHVSADGALRVLRSPDGQAWHPVARLALPGYDLRDADLSRAPDGRLLLVGGAAPRPADGARAPTGTVVAWSRDQGGTWTTPRVVVEPGRWLWRVTWHGERAYGVSYSAGSGAPRIDLLTSTDALDWQPLARDLLPRERFPGAAPNETVLAFETTAGGQERCIALARSEGERPSAFVGVASAPFTTFAWHDLGTHVGGPNLTRTPGGTWIVGGRFSIAGEAHTALAELDPDAGTLGTPFVLPSGGDTSYPGFAWRDGTLWVSYYSSHEPGADGVAHAAIYVARVRTP